MDRNPKADKPVSAMPAPDSEEQTPTVGPYNPALAEIYQRLYPEMKRPKPNQEAIAAALQAMQRLTMKMDSETAVEQTAPQTIASFTVACAACGHHNREGNKFCGMCGLPVNGVSSETAVSELGAGRSASPGPAKIELPDFAREAFQPPPPVLDSAKLASANLDSAKLDSSNEVHPPANASSAAHHYHHHYHHHYFQGGVEGLSANAPAKAGVPESAREADRLRVAAAAKGEPMSRSEASVRRLTQEWVLACNTRQLDELLDLYAPDALVLRSNLPLLRGAAAVREFFFSALESGLGEVSIEPIRVEVVGELAHEVGRYSALVPGTAGKRREERGKYLWVFAKQSGGEWKLVSECWSADLTLTNAESDVPKPAVSTAKPQGRRI